MGEPLDRLGVPALRPPSAPPGDALIRSSGGSCRSGYLAQEPEHLGVEPLGDLGGGCIVVGGDRAGDQS